MRQVERSSILTLLCSPHRIIGASFASNTEHIKLLSFFHQNLDHLEFEKLNLFNPQTIGTHSATWLNQSTHLTCALQGPGLQEQLSLFHTAHPDPSQLTLSHAPHWQWHHTYLYPYDHQHCFYICGIKKSLIFQFQLMAINYSLPLSLLTTERMALLHSYKKLCGSAYRSAQLAQDMMKHHNRIERLFFKEDIQRLIEVPSHISIKREHMLPVLTLSGLYLMQKEGTHGYH